ncbi:serine/threonine protein kinase [Caldichromatium japonicum]|uniref:Serine/threonine protein kinase n=1 Tax=Caldichromatium japonicum TaxID=2699430 RepID=A0A6G7VA27_9GAMM|nr:serine/threonine-protein kinase [Caldichromatium japonicum]QIK36708.1 serine/threonine protein kinase [Caldichromatium japonicum]
MAATRKPLPPGTQVGNYQIIKAIAKGGFSLIYLAQVQDDSEEVVIKEYMPKRLATRHRDLRVVPSSIEYAEYLYQGCKLFFQEVRTLASLKHPNIVRVLDFFLANGTGYLVMPNERGRNLGAYLRERKEGLSTSFILEVFVPILDALSLLHRRSMLHLDVKPGNIHLRHGNLPLLLDLGAVHSFSRSRVRGGQVITAGYSPLEQYYRHGQIGPWTDVYAVGASIRTCMEGRPPQPAPERRKEDRVVPAVIALKEQYPRFLLEAVDWAMAMEPEQRPRDAEALLLTLLPYLDDSQLARIGLQIASKTH